MKDFLHKKSGFTLIEIVVAILISSLVILGLTTLLLKINQEIYTIQTQTAIYGDFSKFQRDFNNFKLKYTKSINIVDNSTGYDVLLLTNSGSERGVIVGIVDITKDSPNYLKLDPVINYSIYGEKVLGLKELSTTQTQNLLSNSGSAYDIKFYDTNLYRSMKVDSFVLNSYNSGAIIDFNMILLTEFSPSLIGEDRSDSVESDKTFRINFSLAKNTNIQLSSLISTGVTLESIPSWTLTGGGDCSTVDNYVGFTGSTSTCADTRQYVHTDTGVIFTGVYNIVKIPSNYNTGGTWRFNKNLAYPLTDSGKYRGDGAWSSTDAGYYSCPGLNTLTTTNCSMVNSKGYLYQWSAIMSGATSTNNTGARVQGICPPGWSIPTKADLLSSSNGYWPYDNSGLRQGNTTGWIRYYVGDRVNSPTGYFETTGNHEYIWTSTLYSDNNYARFHMFYSGFAPASVQAFIGVGFGVSVRCIKN